MTRSQVKLFGAFIVFVDDPAIGSRKLDRVGRDRGENGPKVQSRANRLADFAQGFQFPHRPRKFLGAQFEFLKQPNVLDGNHSLCGEGF